VRKPRGGDEKETDELSKRGPGGHLKKPEDYGDSKGPLQQGNKKELLEGDLRNAGRMS